MPHHLVELVNNAQQLLGTTEMRKGGWQTPPRHSGILHVKRRYCMAPYLPLTLSLSFSPSTFSVPAKLWVAGAYGAVEEGTSWENTPTNNRLHFITMIIIIWSEAY